MALSDFFNRKPPAPVPAPKPAMPATTPPAKPAVPLSAKAPDAPTVDSLSKSMCDRKAVHWAHESAKMAGPAVSPADQHAMDAASAWIKNPSEATKAAAQEAATKAGHGGPGAWAAQAAAWSTHGEKPKAAAVTIAGKVAHQALPAIAKQGAGKLGAALPAVKAPSVSAPAGGSLASLAVSGAVSLAAAMKAGVKLPTVDAKVPAASANPPKIPPKPTPEDVAKMQEAHKPFIDLGKKIAADPSIKC